MVNLNMCTVHFIGNLERSVYFTETSFQSDVHLIQMNKENIVQ